MKLLIITGLSGAGKSYALHALEDAGYYCSDNLPVPLIMDCLHTLSTRERVAITADIRSHDYQVAFLSVLDKVFARYPKTHIVFLWAQPEILKRRFRQTRRPHPLQKVTGNLDEAILQESRALEPLRLRAHTIIDTSDLNIHQLEVRILQQFGDEAFKTEQFILSVQSFGFAYGIPPNLDIVLDVRFLPNPFYNVGMQDQIGLDEPVQQFVIEHAQKLGFLERTLDYLDYLLEQIQREYRAYFAIGFGCTGGRHRSVAIAHTVADHFRAKGITVHEYHRDISRGSYDA